MDRLGVYLLKLCYSCSLGNLEDIAAIVSLMIPFNKGAGY